MDEVIFNDDKQESVEEAVEVFPDDVTEDYTQEDVETAKEIGFPFPEVMQEQNIADYVAQFGQDHLYDVQNATDSHKFSGIEYNQVKSDPVYVPVMDEETKSSIENIESTLNDIYADHLSMIDTFDSINMKILNIRDDLKQLGYNNIFAYKVQTGITVAIFGAIVVYIFFSKFR